MFWGKFGLHRKSNACKIEIIQWQQIQKRRQFQRLHDFDGDNHFLDFDRIKMRDKIKLNIIIVKIVCHEMPIKTCSSPFPSKRQPFLSEGPTTRAKTIQSMFVWKRPGPKACNAFTQTQFVPTFGSQLAFLLNIAEGRQCSAERPVEGPRWVSRF